MKLTDVGTRYEHYRELLDLWENGYDILERRFTQPGIIVVPTDLMKLMLELEGAISLMTKQLEIQADIYMNMDSVRKQVEEIEEPKGLLTEGSELNKPYDGTV